MRSQEVVMPDQFGEKSGDRGEESVAFSELLRLARRCVSPFEDGEESSYTQAEALRDLEAWLRSRASRREWR
jgi:hypothetical protein